MSDLSITRGKFSVADSWFVECDGKLMDPRILGRPATHGERSANAELICEAFNVANQTGLTPKQFLEQRDELLADLKFLVEHIEENGRLAGKTEQAITNFTATYHATIAKAEGQS